MDLNGRVSSLKGPVSDLSSRGDCGKEPRGSAVEFPSAGRDTLDVVCVSVCVCVCVCVLGGKSGFWVGVNRLRECLR